MKLLKAMIIVNPAAGGRDRLKEMTDRVRSVLGGEAGIFDIRRTREKGGAAALATEAVRKGYGLVVACGGDGTVNEVAGPLVGTEVVLGIVPSGSGNGLARALGIPLDPSKALELVKAWRVRKVDVGETCERYFFSTAGFGFDAHLSKKYNEGPVSSKQRGLLPYIPIALREFYRYSPEEVLITIENRQVRVVPFILTVANVERYGGDAVIAPDASPEDGLLDLVILPRVGLSNSYGLARKLLGGKINTVKGYQLIRAQRFEIQRSRSSLVHVDGEPFEWQGSIHIKVHQGRLNVLS